MNKKIVTLIIVILISFSFLSYVVAENATHDDNSTSDHDKKVDNDKKDDKKTPDKNKKTDKNKTDDKSKKNYILAMGSGNDIMFSDGYRGFKLDHSKPSASSGDEFKRVSTSHASNANSLKQSIIESYMMESANHIGKTVDSVIKDDDSNNAAAASHQKVGDHEVVRIDDDTEAVFDFEVLKSVSGNESDYFAYKVSFRNVDANDDENVTNQTTNNVTNVTNTTNITNMTNITALTQPLDNETNATFLKGLFDYLASLANALYDVWKPLINTILSNILMIANALQELANMIEDFILEMSALMYGLEQLLKLLEEIWKGLDGLLKLLGMLLNLIQQIINLIGAILNFIAALISAIIGFIMQLLQLLMSLINFLLDLINQLIALIQAILDLLSSIGSFILKVIENAAIIISAFVIITIGAFVYNRIR